MTTYTDQTGTRHDEWIAPTMDARYANHCECGWVSKLKSREEAEDYQGTHTAYVKYLKWRG